MKKEMLTGFLRLCRRAALSAAVLLLAACSDIANDSTTAGLDAVADDAVTLSDNSGKSDKDTRKDGTSGGSGDNGGGNSGGSTSGGSDIGLSSYTVTGGRPGGWKW